MTVKRKRNFVELQPYMVAYGGIISMVSPLASIYQLSRLNPHIPCSTSQMVKLAAIVFPVQTILKTIQMNISTPVKSNLNVWAAFAVVGVLQGGVYGQCNIYFSKKLGIGKTLSLKGMFRGVGFAGFRDMISQGVPFIFSEYTRKYIFNSILPESKVLPDDTSFNLTEFVRKWGPVLSTSMFATVASQGVHNCQITMQAEQHLTYITTVQTLYRKSGIAGLYRGAEARIGLLIVVNILNELLLKPAWSDVEE